MTSDKKVRLPKKIVVQDQPVIIKSRSRSWARKHKAMGMYTTSSSETRANIIEWDKTQPKDEVVNTIIHEVLHAIYSQQEVKRKSEEEIVRKLADGIEDTLKSNPNLLEWLYTKLKNS